MAGYELEATLVSAPDHDPIVIGRSRIGDHCQVTLERWLPIDGEPGIEDAVNAIRAILTASARPDPARTTDGAVGLPSSAMSAACLGSADREIRRRGRGGRVWGHPPWMSGGYRHADSVSEQVAGWP